MSITISLTGVIDNHGLPKHCRRELGVCQFGIEVELEVWIIVDFFITQNHNLTPLCSFNILLQHIVNNWVNVFIHILEQEWEAVFDGQLQPLQEVWVIE